MPTNIDELQIEINAKAVKANDAIDKLVSKLGVLSTSLSRIDGSKITGLANGVDRLGRAMQVMNTVKTADFTRLAKNIEKLSAINTAGLNNSASALSQITRAFNNLGAVSANAQQIGELASNLSRLGYKSVANAITNIPQLATSLEQLTITLSRSPQVSQNIIDMTNALANLSAQSRSVGSTSNAIVNGLNNTDRAMRRSARSTRSLASAFGRFYASYFLVVRGVKGLYEAIQSTSDYIEAFNYYNVAFGKISSEWSQDWEKYGYENAEAYAESFTDRMSETLGKLSGIQVDEEGGLLSDTGLKNLGLNIQEITQYASQLASVTNSLGQTGESTLAITESFTKLAGDISSLFNVDYSTVSKNLQSGLIGQSRALYKYGIDITNATLQTYAYELGLTKAVSEMTQMEKQQLRVLAILDQSKVSWGDLANTIESPSNMLRQLTTNLNEAGMVLGQLFIPLMSKILPLANGATIALKRLLVEIAGFFGVSIDFEQFGQGYTDLEDGLGNIADGYEDLTDAVNEYQNQLLGFDEVNKLTENSSITLGDVTGGEIDLTDEIISATEEYQKVWDEAFANMENSSLKWADAIGSTFQDIADYISPTTDAIGNLWDDGLSKLVDFSSDNLEGFYNNFLKPVSDWTIGEGIPALADVFNDFLNDVDWKDLNKNFDDFYKAVEPFAEGFGEGFIDFIDAAADIGADVINLIGDGVGVLADGFEAIGVTNMKEIGEFFGTVVPIILTMKVGASIGKNFETAGKGIKTFIDNLKGHPYLTIASGIAGLGIAYKTFIDDLHKEFLSTKAGEVQQAVDELSGKLEDLTLNIGVSFGDVEVNDKYYREIAGEYLELSNNFENLTETEKSLLERYADELAEYSDEIVGYIDPITKAWNGTSTELTDILNKTKEYYQTQAITSAKSSTYDVITEAKLGLYKAQEELKVLEEEMYNSIVSYGKQIGKTFDISIADIGTGQIYELYKTLHLGGGFFSALGNALTGKKDVDSQAASIIKSMEEYNSILEDAQGTLNALDNISFDNLDEGIREATETIETLNSAIEITNNSSITVDTSSAKVDISKLKNKIDTLTQTPKRTTLLINNSDFTTGLQDSETQANNFQKKYGKVYTVADVDSTTFNQKINANISTWNAAVSQMNGNQPAMNLGVQTSMAAQEIKSFVDQAAKDLATISPSLSLIDPLGWGKVNFAGKFANGGFVSAGQVFVAREAGPELVGTMGGRTAVANNDQITQGIAQAVYNAFTSALATTNTSSGGDIVINIDGKQVFKAVQRQANNYTAQTGQSPFPV